MASGAFIAYYRVSTERQGRSGLGLDAQREAVRSHLNGGQWRLVAEVVEVESGKRSDRPKLAEALRLCRLHGATLIIAKLDRLARNVAFVSNLMESGVEFVAVDFPQANRLTVHILAAVAEHEARAISERTKVALAAKKAWYASLDDAQRAKLVNERKATKLGGDRGNLAAVRHIGTASSALKRASNATARAGDVAPIIAELQAGGASLRQVAATLTDRGIPTPRGAGAWTAMGVKRAMERIGPATA